MKSRRALALARPRFDVLLGRIRRVFAALLMVYFALRGALR